MLEPLLVSEIKERALLYLYTHGESYPREIARSLGLYIHAVQYQLLKLEKGGVLYSKLKGKIRLFGINPRYPFKKELEALLEKALSFIPEEEMDRIFRPRLRPLSVGEEPVREIREIRQAGKVLKLLSPTDCVKDRLAAFYHWNDRQSLGQAVLVCRDVEIDLKEVERWSVKEGMKAKFNQFKQALLEKKHPR